MPRKGLSMRKIEEVLRLKYEARLPHRAIAKSCGISASTVSEYVAAAKANGLSWPLSEGLSSEELNARLFPQRQAKAERIAQPEWQKIHKELRRKGVTRALLWAEYRQSNPDGYSYSQFCTNYKTWSKRLKPPMRLRYQGGEKVFVDYAGQTVPIIDPKTGEISQAQIFVGTLGASNYTYVEAQASQNLPNWIGGHVRMFNFFGGVPEVVVPDNLKAGVTKPNRYEPDLNPTYHEFAKHYNVAVVPARVRKPQDKAKVETAVQIAERWILARLRDQQFFSIAELNAAIAPLSAELNERTMQHLDASRAELFKSLDQPVLKPLPAQPYEYAEWKRVKVHIDYHVQFDQRFYSVPYKLRGKRVDVRATENTIEVYHDNKRVASHKRLRRKGFFATIREHMPPQHQAMADWSPERFLSWAGEIGNQTQTLIAAVLERRPHPQQAYRSCLGILGLAKKVGNARLEAASQRALAAKLYSYRGVRNILDNQLDKLPLDPPVATPQPPHTNIRGGSYYH